jgi:hypothetical protein
MMKSGIRSLAAVIVTAIALAAVPAQAQKLGTEFSFGGGKAQSDTQSFSTQRHSGPSIQICLTNRQIRRGLRDYGFTDIQFVRNLPRERVVVEALYEDDWYYSMRVHRCKGYVDRVRPLYPAWDDDY